MERFGRNDLRDYMGDIGRKTGMLLSDYLWSYCWRFDHYGVDKSCICLEIGTKYHLWDRCFIAARTANQQSLCHMQPNESFPPHHSSLALSLHVSLTSQSLAIPSLAFPRLLLLLQHAVDYQTYADTKHIHRDGRHHRNSHHFDNQLRRCQQLHCLPDHHPQHFGAHQDRIPRQKMIYIPSKAIY